MSILQVILIFNILMALDMVSRRFSKFTWKKFKQQCQNAWHYIRFWKPIQENLRQKTPHFLNNKELELQWVEQVRQTILNNQEIRDLLDNSFGLEFLRNPTPEQIEMIKKAKEINQRIRLSKAEFQLNWLKEKHPKFYWLKKLKII